MRSSPCHVRHPGCCRWLRLEGSFQGLQRLGCFSASTHPMAGRSCGTAPVTARPCRRFAFSVRLTGCHHMWRALGLIGLERKPHEAGSCLPCSTPCAPGTVAAPWSDPEPPLGTSTWGPWRRAELVSDDPPGVILPPPFLLKFLF